ncbi:hypothetical protein ACR6C2_00075 [Streptomyces sp. INA 01156]
MKAHRTVLERLALKPPVWPFRTFDGPRGFGTYWRANGMSGSGGWQARRDCIEQILGPTRNALEDLQELEYERRFTKGPSGAFKNLIFAADGAKPDLVLRDAVNNEVEIVRHADACLVFTDPLPHHGLTWRQMVTWWQKNHQPDVDEKTAADGLYRRLYRSLDSVPEQLLMITYCARYAEDGGFDLPALIPQVYLHYDPYTRKSGKQSGALPRQRMDFLLLAPDRSRIVLEVDGVQHYGRPNPPTRKGASRIPRCRGCTRRWSPRTADSGSPGTRSTASAAGNSPHRAAEGSSRTSSPLSSRGTRNRRRDAKRLTGAGGRAALSGVPSGVAAQRRCGVSARWDHVRGGVRRQGAVVAVEWDRVGQPGFDRIVEALVHRMYDASARVEVVNGRGGTRASTSRSPTGAGCGSSS